jgi:hypothetical protein
MDELSYHAFDMCLGLSVAPVPTVEHRIVGGYPSEREEQKAGTGYFCCRYFGLVRGVAELFGWAIFSPAPAAWEAEIWHLLGDAGKGELSEVK